MAAIKTTTNSKPATAPKAKPAPAAKPKKTHLEKAFTTAAVITRGVEKLSRTTGAWKGEGTSPAVEACLKSLHKAVAHMSECSEDLKHAIVELGQHNYKPKAPGYVGPRAAIAVGGRVELKPKVLENRFDFLTEAQRQALYVEKEDPRGFLVVCKLASAPTTLGYLKRGALLAAAATVTPITAV